MYGIKYSFVKIVKRKTLIAQIKSFLLQSADNLDRHANIFVALSLFLYIFIPPSVHVS